MRSLAITTLMVLIWYDLSAAQNVTAVVAQPKARLLITGHEDTAPPRIGSDEVWFALQHQGGQWTLRRVKPTAVAETPMVGLEGTRISAEGVDEGSYLIGAVPNLREGPVTANITERQVLYLGQTVSVLHGYWLEAEGTAMGSQYGGGMVFLDYAFWLSGQNRRELLVTKPRMSTENPPSIEWAGDLDHDAVPDFILNVPQGDVGAHLMLYLSSLASDGQMVSPVAAYVRPGC